MICIAGNRPVLQIGRQQVTSYGSAWLRQSIIRGAEASKREDFPFVDDLMQGIMHYLEHKCPLRLLTIEELHARIQRMLKRIGYGSIAETLPLLAPPVTVSLREAARKAGNGFELAFFNQIQEEIQDLRNHGVEELHFTDIMESIKELQGTLTWSPGCDVLHQELVTFLSSHGIPSLPSPQEIRLNLV